MNHTLQLSGMVVVVLLNPSRTVIFRMQMVVSRSSTGIDKREATSANNAGFFTYLSHTINKTLLWLRDAWYFYLIPQIEYFPI